MSDDYVWQILGGDMPDELNTVFQRFRPGVFATFLTVVSYVAAATRQEILRCYALPELPVVRAREHSGFDGPT